MARGPTHRPLRQPASDRDRPGQPPPPQQPGASQRLAFRSVRAQCASAVEGGWLGHWLVAAVVVAVVRAPPHADPGTPERGLAQGRPRTHRVPREARHREALPRALPLPHFMTRTRSMQANPSQNGRIQRGDARSPAAAAPPPPRTRAPACRPRRRSSAAHSLRRPPAHPPGRLLLTFVSRARVSHRQIPVKVVKAAQPDGNTAHPSAARTCGAWCSCGRTATASPRARPPTRRSCDPQHARGPPHHPTIMISSHHTRIKTDLSAMSTVKSSSRPGAFAAASHTSARGRAARAGPSGAAAPSGGRARARPAAACADRPCLSVERGGRASGRAGLSVERGERFAHRAQPPRAEQWLPRRPCGRAPRPGRRALHRIARHRPAVEVAAPQPRDQRQLQRLVRWRVAVVRARAVGEQRVPARGVLHTRLHKTRSRGALRVS
eukprot:COSAG01_NODE_2359_length_7836_cov_107.706605_8_plen_437_part_00